MIELSEIAKSVAEVTQTENLSEEVKTSCENIKSTMEYLNILCKESESQNVLIGKAEENLLIQVNKIESKCHNYLISKGHSQMVYDFLKDTVHVKIEEYGNGFNFQFASLFPPRGNIINQAICGNYHRTIRGGYRAAIDKEIQRFFNGENPPRYNERVAVEVVFFFADRKEIKDYDNFEAKAITDIITPYFIYDDSPEYESLHFDYRMSNFSHVEIRILSEKDYFKSKL